MKKLVETQHKLFDELYTLSNLIQDVLDKDFGSTGSTISTTYKKAILSHISEENYWNTLPFNHIKIKNVEIYKEKRYSLSRKPPSLKG